MKMKIYKMVSIAQIAHYNPPLKEREGLVHGEYV